MAEWVSVDNYFSNTCIQNISKKKREAYIFLDDATFLNFTAMNYLKIYAVSGEELAPMVSKDFAGIFLFSFSSISYF